MVFSCEDTAQQVLMSVCPCEFQVEILSQCAIYSSRMFQNVPECMQNVPEFPECMQNVPESMQKACKKFQNVPECMQNVPECYRIHAECSRMNADQ